MKTPLANRRTRWPGLLAAAALCWLMSAATGNSAEPAAPPGEQDPPAADEDSAAPSTGQNPSADRAAAGELNRLIDELNHDQYDVRERAASRLAQLALQPETQAELANQVQRALLSPQTPFEVRTRLAALARKLPPVGEPPPADVSDDQLDRLIVQMDAASYAVRQGAAARLQWLAARPELACPIMARLKGRLAEPQLSAELREQMAPILQTARRAWLTSDPRLWRLDDVPEQQIERWLNELVAQHDPGTDGRPATARRKGDDARAELDSEDPEPEAAAIAAGLLRGVAGQSGRDRGRTGPSQLLEGPARELVDLMVRDGYLPRVKQAIERRLAEGVHPGAEARLTELVDWTRPAMVAEYWESRRHLGIQHLLIGVPSFSPLAERPSHFDRIDEQTAHCVSGNALTAGQDYPVGVLFPHPKRANAQFHLVHLPTPRHRLAYEYLVQADEAGRLVELSERTLSALLAEKRGMSEAELIMLRHLDPGAVSRFAGRYLLAVDDGPLPGDFPRRGWTS
ncbi:MAG: hypothetical protein WD278_03870, partial [Pirellulales bacterium]